MAYSDKFEKSISFVLKKEGFISDNPADPGALTIFGIAAKYHPGEVARMKEMVDAGRKDEALAIAKDVYWREYWSKTGCEEIDYPMCMCVLDTAVNPGVPEAKAFLDKAADWREYLFLRVNYYNHTREDLRQAFEKGWINRVIDLWQEITYNEHPLSEQM